MQKNDKYFNNQFEKYSQKHMVTQNKFDDNSKLGTSRVHLFQKYGLVNCYTLEIHYNVTNSINNHNGPKQYYKFLNESDFISLGKSVVQSLNMFFFWQHYFSREDVVQFKTGIALQLLKRIPYRFIYK